MSEKKKINEELLCSFCGGVPDPDNGKVLLQGQPGVYICSDCIEECREISLKFAPKNVANILKDGFKPSDVTAHLNQYVIGQDHAKMVLATAVYNHYKMLSYKSQKNPLVEIEKSNVLMAGPTGSGKTYILRTLAKMLDVPFATGDASSLTAAGYVGDDVENIIRLLLEDADMDVKKAQKGIIYIDEIDKIGRKGENVSLTRDVGGEGVQQALLKIIEGAMIEVPPKGGRKHPQQTTIKVDTSNILFIVGGSFEGIEKIIQKRQDISSMGFGAVIQEKKEVTLSDVILDIEVEDFKKFGMLPEFLGRMPIICPLTELTRDDLLKVLTEPKNALCKQYQELISMDNVELEFEDEALLAIADKAITRRTGARSLRSIMEETLLKHMYSLPDNPDITKVIITKGTVLGTEDPILILKEAC